MSALKVFSATRRGREWAGGVSKSKNEDEEEEEEEDGSLERVRVHESRMAYRDSHNAAGKL